MGLVCDGPQTCREHSAPALMESVSHGGQIIAFHPGFAARTDFLFPDGHDLFEPVDGIAACFETTLAAVAARHADHHGHIAHFQVPDALHHGYVYDVRPLSPRLVGNLPHFGDSHVLVSFVL